MKDLVEVAEPYGTFFHNLLDQLPSLGVALLIVGFFTYGGWKYSGWVTQGFRGGKYSIQKVLYRRVIFGFILLLGLIMVLPIFRYTQIATFFLTSGRHHRMFKLDWN